jgi:hypothetical protein
MPPANEHTVTAPLPEIELRQLIHQAYGDDESTAMLTQVMFWSGVKRGVLLNRVCLSHWLTALFSELNMSVAMVNSPVMCG